MPEASSIEPELIQRVVQQTREIGSKYGRPIDLEWVYDGQVLYWVQLREITALDVPIYSNRISMEVFPGIIKPLIWSVNVPLVNGAWTRLITELTGSRDIDPDSLAGLFYYRAYFNMGTMGQVFEMLGLPRETLELLIGLEAEGPEKPSFRPSSKTYSLMPRMLLFALDKLRFGRKLDRCLPEKEEQFRAFDQAAVAEMNEGEILETIDRLFETAQEMAYCNIVTPLLMYLYNRMLREQLERAGLVSANLDVTSGMEELRQFEPGVHLAILKEHYDALEPALQSCIAESSYEEFCRLPGITLFQKQVRQFIDRFGHLSDSGNDFSSVPWRETPDLILRMIVEYERTQMQNGHKLKFQDLDLPIYRRALIRPTYKSARRFRWYREAVSSLYTYGYGLFRILFLALGDRFASRGAISSAEDIFYLYYDEVQEITGGRAPGVHYKTIIETRKREIKEAREVEPPSIIYGDSAPATLVRTGNRLDGIPTSRGQYTGQAKVLQGIEDFAKLEIGDVLVIPYSDVSWTPLFAKAGAVVAESGGILSHSSIVAREYNIPAVVSVSGACRLRDGVRVTVDGYRGVVIVHEPQSN
jgi:pyruvate,water dikinase